MTASPDRPEQQHPQGDGVAEHPGFGRSLGVFWFYTLGRVAVFGVLFGILWFFGIGGFLGAIIAVFVSIPISYFLLSRPRDALARNIETRVENSKMRRTTMDKRLSGEE